MKSPLRVKILLFVIKVLKEIGFFLSPLLAPARLKLAKIFLSQPHKCWDYRHVLLCLAQKYIFIVLILSDIYLIFPIFVFLLYLCVTVNFNCQFDEIYSHLGDEHFKMPVRDYLDQFLLRLEDLPNLGEVIPWIRFLD